MHDRLIVGTHNRYVQVIAIVLTVVLIMSLLHILYLGSYNQSTSGDYYYGAQSHIVWEETGSITATVAEAARRVACDYKTWQGTYSAMFFMRLAPNVFSENAYHYVTMALWLLLAGGNYVSLLPSILILICLASALLYRRQFPQFYGKNR